MRLFQKKRRKLKFIISLNAGENCRWWWALRKYDLKARPQASIALIENVVLDVAWYKNGSYPLTQAKEQDALSAIEEYRSKRNLIQWKTSSQYSEFAVNMQNFRKKRAH